MRNDKFIDYTLPTDAYVTFDATSLRDFINDRLANNQYFTDQDFQGSNLSNIVEIISASFHTLLFYLNRTSSESQFTQTQLYENMNRLIKLIDYNPSGFQTSVLNFVATSTLNKGNYVIPRYSFFNINGVVYSFKGDSTFIKNVDGQETLSDFNNNYVLYQGKFRRKDLYVPFGEDFEVIELSSKNKNIDANGVDVYVKRNNKWFEWNKVSNLFDAEYNDLAYEIRYNERGNYEIKFGDDIHGSKLKVDDQVIIYYLECDGVNGQVSSGFLNGTFTLYSENFYDSVISDIAPNVSYITNNQKSSITFTNTLPSTTVYDGESVEEIRNNLGNFVKSAGSLINLTDFESYFKNNYGGLISSIKAISNTTFLNTHIKYLSDLGITSPFKESRILANQLLQGNSCNFNNIYVYIVPRFEQSFSTTNKFFFINDTQKTLFLNEIERIKSPTVEVIFEDPVFVATDIGYNNSNYSLSDIGNTTLQIVRSNITKDKGSIINNVITVFRNYFKSSNCELGQIIDINYLTNQILNIDGVSSFYTKNGDLTYNGLNLYIWNPIYPQDLNSKGQNLKLEDFKFPYLNDFEALKNRIVVE